MNQPTEKSHPATHSEKRKNLSLKKLQAAIDRYFNECDRATKETYVKSSGTIELISSPRPYTLEGLSIATGISREDLLNQEENITNRKLLNTINQAKLRIQENIISRALEGDANSTITTFILKNNFGYKDKTDLKTTGRDDEDTIQSIHVKVIHAKDEL